MPAEIVIVGQQLQQPQQVQIDKQNFNINLCGIVRRSGVDVDAALTDNPINAADVDVAAAATAIAAASTLATSTTARRRALKRSQQSNAKATSTLRTVIIIMALVFSIMQKHQQQQQQQQEQQMQQWPFCYGLFAAAAAAATATVTPNSSNIAAELSVDATNHTFESLAFLGNTAATPADGFAVAAPATETELLQSLPVFDFGMPRNITGRTGHTEAVIKCRVDSLHDKSVSWIRKRDLHILTVGTATYTSDKRFQVTESKDARDWTLHVKSPQAKDSGIYECQVNTEPKMSMAFQLNIIEISPDAKAIISGPHDLHFKAGSAIILNCVVKQPSVKDIGPIYWYRGEHMITPFDADDDDDDDVEHDDKDETERKKGRQRAEQATDQQDQQTINEVLSNELQRDFTTRIAMESQLGDTLKSRLRISNAQTTDTGNYTCQPTTASSASVMVHVINDENPAAMQKSASSSLALFGQHWQQRLCLMFALLLPLQWAKY